MSSHGQGLQAAAASAAALQVVIVSPEKTLYTGEVRSVSVPGEKGRFEILRGHAPIISSLVRGTVECGADETFSLEIEGGFVEVARNRVSLCVELRRQ